ncbi:hypothetical protein ILYODFUR_019093 [Ilyodon furcidens]|uniref:MD-2-related lipid-recognition domain-containing protein n=1 Tax=Ilyodon furcidens TaxID=33524 RepID=A0ABV0UW22_9TELE
MARFLEVTVVVTVVLAAVIFQVNCGSFRLKRVGHAKVLGFDWKNCGQPDAPAVLKTLTVSPDPINIPGSLTAAASGSTSVELTAPLSVSWPSLTQTRNN